MAEFGYHLDCVLGLSTFIRLKCFYLNKLSLCCVNDQLIERPNAPISTHSVTNILNRRTHGTRITQAV